MPNERRKLHFRACLLMGGAQYGKTHCDYISVGGSNPSVFAKAKDEGKIAPFFVHANNFQVDLGAIPSGTMTGATALMAIFKN